MGDLVQPGPGVLGLLERVVVLVGLDERVLGQVGGELRVAQHPQEVGVDLAFVLREQRLDERARPRRGPTCRSSDATRGSRGGVAAKGLAEVCEGSVDGHVDSGRDWDVERGRWAARTRWPNDDGPPARVTPSPDAGDRDHPGPAQRSVRPSKELLHRVLRRDRVDRQAGAQLEAGDLAQARVDLPVPVVRRVHLLLERGRVEDEVVGRPVEAGREPAQDLAERLGGGRDVAVVARPKSASWRRGTIHISNGEREAYGAKATLAWSSQTSRSGRRDSSRTSRQNGHSPSRMTKRAAPPSSSAIRCGIWGRSYRSRHRWLVRAPACAPQFWTTWR